MYSCSWSNDVPFPVLAFMFSDDIIFNHLINSFFELFLAGSLNRSSNFFHKSDIRDSSGFDLITVIKNILSDFFSNFKNKLSSTFTDSGYDDIHVNLASSGISSCLLSCYFH